MFWFFVDVRKKKLLEREETKGDQAGKLILESQECTFKKKIEYFFKDKIKVITVPQTFDRYGIKKLEIETTNGMDE